MANPAPITDADISARPWLQRKVWAAPDGRLDHDGSSPDRATALETQVGYEDDWPMILVKFRLDDSELERLKAGGFVYVHLRTTQMPVIGMTVEERPD